MAQSRVSISNRALQILGAKKRILDPDEDSANARECAVCYEPLRDALVESHPWRFARTRATLALYAGTPAVAGDSPEFDYQYAFTLPTDFVRWVLPRDEIHDWEIRGDKLMTSESNVLYFNYIKRVTDPTQFPPSFAEALSADMAAAMCEAITQSNEKKADAQQRKKEALSEAKHSNAFQTLPVDPVEDTWLSCRL